jgi:hypothetical protein
MLPGVNAHERHVVARYRILIHPCDHLERARGLVLGQPGPAAALDTSQDGVNMFLEVIEGTKILFDGGLVEEICQSCLAGIMYMLERGPLSDIP